MTTMSAIGSFNALPVDDPQALQDITADVPELRPHDVLVRVLAVSVNPVDIKRRAGLSASATPTILGYDAAGVVEAVGPEVATLVRRRRGLVRRRYQPAGHQRGVSRRRRTHRRPQATVTVVRRTPQRCR